MVALTLAEPPGETTHWTGRAMAKAAGVSLSYVQRVWRSHGLQIVDPGNVLLGGSLHRWAIGFPRRRPRTQH
jgi:hypothetical protein